MFKRRHIVHTPMSRREMLGLCKNGFGSLAFMSLFGSISSACKQLEVPDIRKVMKRQLPHFVPKAKNIIFLYMDGGVSQVDSFDPKPRLIKEHGQDPRMKFKVDNTQFDDVGKILKIPKQF